MAGDTQAFATRVSPDEAERIELAVGQIDTSRSELLADALRFYMEANPDEIPAFRPDDSELDPLAKLGVLPPRTQHRAPRNSNR